MAKNLSKTCRDIVTGESLNFPFTWREDSGLPFDLTGFVNAEFWLVKQGEESVRFTFASHVTIGVGEDNLLVVLDPVDTLTLIEGRFIGRIQIEDPAGKIHVIPERENFLFIVKEAIAP